MNTTSKKHQPSDAAIEARAVELLARYECAVLAESQQHVQPKISMTSFSQQGMWVLQQKLHLLMLAYFRGRAIAEQEEHR